MLANNNRLKKKTLFGLNQCNFKSGFEPSSKILWSFFKYFTETCLKLITLWIQTIAGQGTVKIKFQSHFFVFKSNFLVIFLLESVICNSSYVYIMYFPELNGFRYEKIDALLQLGNDYSLDPKSNSNQEPEFKPNQNFQDQRAHPLAFIYQVFENGNKKITNFQEFFHLSKIIF